MHSLTHFQLSHTQISNCLFHCIHTVLTHTEPSPHLSKHLSTLSDMSNDMQSCSSAMLCMSHSVPWLTDSHSRRVSGSRSIVIHKPASSGDYSPEGLCQGYSSDSECYSEERDTFTDKLDLRQARPGRPGRQHMCFHKFPRPHQSDALARVYTSFRPSLETSPKLALTLAVETCM